MKKVIQYMPGILIKNLFLFLIILAGCQNSDLKTLPKTVNLETDRGEIIKTTMAYSAQDQAQAGGFVAGECKGGRGRQTQVRDRGHSHHHTMPADLE